jgi:hypothetical protein
MLPTSETSPSRMGIVSSSPSCAARLPRSTALMLPVSKDRLGSKG